VQLHIRVRVFDAPPNDAVPHVAIGAGMVRNAFVTCQNNCRLVASVTECAVPEAMQKKFGYAPLGEGPVKSAIFGLNNARLYDIQPKRAMLDIKGDRLAMTKAAYQKAGPEPSNTRYGYVVPNGPMDHSVFA
jgi:hypothetical protein